MSIKEAEHSVSLVLELKELSMADARSINLAVQNPDRESEDTLTRVVF